MAHSSGLLIDRCQLYGSDYSSLQRSPMAWAPQWCYSHCLFCTATLTACLPTPSLPLPPAPLPLQQAGTYRAYPPKTATEVANRASDLADEAR